MRAYLIAFFTLVSISSSAQWPGFNRAHPVSCQLPEFNYTAHGYFENVFVIDTIPNFYDGYLVFGNGILCHPDSVINFARCFSAKCNTNGDLFWWRRYDNTIIDESQEWWNSFEGNRGGMVLNHSKQIVSILSSFVSTDMFNEETRNYLVTMDVNGEILEQQLVDSTWAQYSFQGLIEDPTDSTYVGYGVYRDSTAVVQNDPPDAFIMKMDSLGNHIWQETYTDLSSVWSLAKAKDGGYWVINEKGVTACSDGFFANTDMVLLKTDELGNEEDRIQLGGSCGLEQATVHEYELDKIVLAGRLTNEDGPSGGPYQGYIYTKLVEQLSNGQLTNPTETKEYLNSGSGIFTDFHHLKDDTYVITGYNLFNSNTIQKGYLLKLNPNRDSLWCRAYTCYEEVFTGQEQHDAWYYLLDSKTTPDGGFVCSGWIYQWEDNPNPYLQTPWLFKVDSLGCIEPGCQDVGVSEIVIGLQNTMSAYPNPTKDIANITFKLPSSFHEVNTELVVINMQGGEVWRQNLTPSSFIAPVQVNLSNFAAGVYTVHWVSGAKWYDSVKLVKEY